MTCRRLIRFEHLPATRCDRELDHVASRFLRRRWTVDWAFQGLLLQPEAELDDQLYLPSLKVDERLPGAESHLHDSYLYRRYTAQQDFTTVMRSSSDCLGPRVGTAAAVRLHRRPFLNCVCPASSEPLPRNPGSAPAVDVWPVLQQVAPDGFPVGSVPLFPTQALEGLGKTIAEAFGQTSASPADQSIYGGSRSVTSSWPPTDRSPISPQHIQSWAGARVARETDKYGAST